MRAVAAFLITLAIAGCSEKKETANPAPTTPSSPHQYSLYDQIHSGLFQADAAVEKMGRALDLAKGIEEHVSGDIAEPLKDLEANLDDDGTQLAELTGDTPPTDAEVKASPDKFKLLHDKLVNRVKDSLKDLRDQVGAMTDLSNAGPELLRKDFANLAQLINQAIDDLQGALSALGGKEE